MAWLSRLARRLRLLARLDAAERSMDDEMRAHLEFDIAERIARGASPAAARAAARRAFGPVESLKEAGRDARGTRLVEDLLRDLRQAARVLRHHRAFTVSATLTLALGIGATTAIYSVVYGVLLRPLPYHDPDRLVAVWEHYVPRGMDRNVTSVANFESWQSRVTAFEGLAALVPAPVTVPSLDGPQRVIGAEVSPGYFGMLGVHPMLGREFTAGEARGAGVVVISEGFWRRHLGADPAVIGRRIDIGGRPHTHGAAHEIVGVMPAGFEPPAFGWLGVQELWVPFVPAPENRAYGRYLHVVARLRPGISIDSARAEVIALAANLRAEGRLSDGWSSAIVPLADQISGDVRSSFMYILAAVALLLALAVTNVSVLMLARTARRMHELGLRRALGASEGRLRRQILTEAALLGACGCAAGLLAASPLVDALVSLLPLDVPRRTSIRLDANVLLAAVAASGAGALVIGALAARRGRRAPSVLLRDGTARGTARASGRLLVIAEVAIGLMVAVLAALAIRSFTGLRAVDPGFDAQGVVAARVALGTEYATPRAQRAFFDELLARVRSHRAIREAGVTSGRPFGGNGPVTDVRDAATVAAETDLVADGRWADAGFFRALDVPLVAGALFDDTDQLDGPVRVIVNESLARAVWPDLDPIGQTAHISLFGGLTATVIGVVGDVDLGDPRTRARAGFYLSPRRFGGETYDIVVKSDAAPAVVIAHLRAALASIDPSLPLHRIQTLDDAVGVALARDRFAAILLSAFAVLALVLASIGVYGVFAADVATRRKEIGIRMALGASARGVAGGILRSALASAFAGLVAGGAAAALLARSMQSLLFGVGATDPWAFGSASASILAVTLVATLLPALRAARRSPLAALRE